MRTKWMYTIMMLALGFFASCKSETDEAAGNKKTRTVVFRLSVDDAVGSRAAWSTNESSQDGTDMENRIDLNGLRVAVHPIGADGTAGTRIGVVDDLLYWAINGSSAGSDDPIEYQLVGDISDMGLTEGTSYRFMVDANFPHDSNLGFGLEDIDVTDGYIPMWGVTTHQIEGGELEDLGTIDLLRAAAKVEVTFDETVTDNYTVSGLAIKNYNETGNNLPAGWDSTDETKNLDMKACINTTGDHVHGNDLPFLNSEDNGKYYIYIPEYNNVAHEAADQSVVVITLANKARNTSGTYEVPFCTYKDGSQVANTVHNIVRNHIYRFNVTGVAEKEGRLLLNFKVADWEEAPEIDLGSLDYPTYLNPLLPSREHGYPTEAITKEAEMKYVAKGDNNNAEREEAGFNAYFRFISANVENTGDTYPWRPTIIDNIATHWSIKVYKVDDGSGETLVYDSGEDGEQELKTDYIGWFRIVVIPENGNPENKTFTLGIACTIHPSGFPSEGFYLFINGENDDIAWPDSGNDRKFIEITQVVE